LSNVPDVTEEAEQQALRDVRQLTDPRDMRALAHPIRIALLEMLLVHGSLTATQAGELIGESASSCSFHLRTLARHHFVEEAGDGRGRERPWRLVSIGMNIPEVQVGTETFDAASTLAQIFAERQLGRLRQWWVRRRNVDQEWFNATSQSEHTTWCTPAELAEINDAVSELLSRHSDRLTHPELRPPDAKLVEMLYYSYLSPLGESPDDATASDATGEHATGEHATAEGDG
jgi:DNA-binding transcriptional ArsR family regulator